MPADNLTAQFDAKRAEIVAALQNGTELTIKQVGWMVYGMLEIVEGMDRKQQYLHDKCEARLAYERGGWWRSLVRDKLATVGLTLLVLGVVWAIAQAVGGGFQLP